MNKINRRVFQDFISEEVEASKTAWERDTAITFYNKEELAR